MHFDSTHSVKQSLSFVEKSHTFAEKYISEKIYVHLGERRVSVWLFAFPSSNSPFFVHYIVITLFALLCILSFSFSLKLIFRIHITVVIDSLLIVTGSEMVNLTAVVHPTARFHALSGFFAVYDKLNLSGRATLPKIWEKGQQLCSKSWSDQTSISQNGYFAWQYCFRVPYMASLVEDALCLGDKTIVFGPPDVTWTLGAALVEGEYLWSSTIRSRTSILTLNMEVASSPIFVLVLLLFLLLVVYCSHVKLPMIDKKGAARASLPVREQKMMD